METARIEKGLNYTTTLYETIADEAANRIKNMQNEEAKVVVAEYGIYYNAIAGLIRSGVLCSRVTGTDGMPEIRVVSGSKVYQCRESILRMILGDEADYIISPYEDTFESYVDLTFPKVPTADEEETSTEQSDSKHSKNEIKNLNAQHKAEIAKLKQQYEEEIKQLKSATPETQIKTETIRETVSDPEQEKQISRLMSENEKLKNENESLHSSISKNEEDTKQLRHQLKLKTAELDDKNKYVYDPNYDHYYSDELPNIIETLEFTHKDLAAKFVAIAGCMAGLVVSALLFL